MKRLMIAIAVAFLMVSSALAGGPEIDLDRVTNEDEAILKLYKDARADAQGRAKWPESEGAYAAAEAYGDLLFERGYCNGHGSETATYQYSWHRCDEKSHQVVWKEECTKAFRTNTFRENCSYEDIIVEETVNEGKNN